MSTIGGLRKCLVVIGLLTILLVTFPVSNVKAQSAAHLTVTVTGQALTAGFNNTLVITVQNDFYPNIAIYDVDIAITIPAGLGMFGVSHRHYDSIQLGKAVTISVPVYAPTSSIGTSYQGSITATYKQLGDISYTQEAHAFSLSVFGWINLIVYGVILTPALTTPGGNVTISGNILNGGNLAAFNTNVTVESAALAPNSASSAYIGEVDPNIPRPFSVFVSFKPILREGNYTLLLKVSAIDTNRPSSPFTAGQTAQVTIQKPSVEPVNRRQSQSGIISILLEILRSLYETFFGSPSSTPSFGSVNVMAHSYFKATTAFILEARHAG